MYSVSDTEIKQLINKELDLQIIKDDYTHDPREANKFYLDPKKMPQLKRNILLSVQMSLVLAEEYPSIYSITCLEKLKFAIIGKVSCELIKI